MKIAIFASGNGSNFQSIAEAINNGQLASEIGFVFCDNSSAFVVERARKLNIPIIVFSPKEFRSKTAYEMEILKHLTENNIQLIVLAGYMRIVGSTLLETFKNRMINIHPSLLPQFPGRYGIKEAFEARVKETGVTIHYVDDGVDTGPIIKQEKVSINDNDTLEMVEAKIHQIEHRLYPEVLDKIISKNKEWLLDGKETSTNQCFR